MSIAIEADSTEHQVKAAIDAEYDAGGYEHGWSYHYSPPSKRLAPPLVVMGLNPGGGYEKDSKDDRLNA